jgi:hypothetical protein
MPSLCMKATDEAETALLWVISRFSLHTCIGNTRPIVLWVVTKPTVCHDVISLVVSSCGYNRGKIEPRVAHESTAHVATQRGLVERPHHHHPPRAQPIAPMRWCHGRRPRLTPRSYTAQAPHREQKRPGGRTREEKRSNRFKFLMMRGPSADPLFASGPWPRHSWLLVGSS